MSIEKRFFDRDPLTGAVEHFYFDHATGQFAIERTEDVTHLVETTKFLQNNNRTDWKGEWHHVASIPLTLLPELAKQGIMTAGGRIIDKEKYRRWLNDRDNRVFRTKLGRV